MYAKPLTNGRGLSFFEYFGIKMLIKILQRLKKVIHWQRNNFMVVYTLPTRTNTTILEKNVSLY